MLDIVKLFTQHNIQVDLYDPVVDPADVKDKFGQHVIQKICGINKNLPYDVLFLAVPHNQIKIIGYETMRSFLTDKGVFFDLKSFFYEQDNIFRL